MELKLSQFSLPTPIFNPSSFFPKHISVLSQKWKLDIQRISFKGPETSKKILVHVVKEGETLSSISKLYGVPILEIAAANKEILDVDLVFQGQNLNIPSVAVNPQMFHFEGNKLNGLRSPNESPNLDFQWSRIFTMPLSHRLPIAKTTGSLLLLVPLFVFCIGCIMGAFQNIVARKLRLKKSKLHHHHHNKFKGVRWRTALSDLGDPESLDSEPEPEPEPEPDSDPLSEDLERLQFEDTSHVYNKVEGEYKKFLSECGMSNWGYWRGGSPH